MTDQPGNEPKPTPEEQQILDAAEKAKAEAEKKLEYDKLMKKRYARLFLDQAILEGGL